MLRDSQNLRIHFLNIIATSSVTVWKVGQLRLQNKEGKAPESLKTASDTCLSIPTRDTNPLDTNIHWPWSIDFQSDSSAKPKTKGLLMETVSTGLVCCRICDSVSNLWSTCPSVLDQDTKHQTDPDHCFICVWMCVWVSDDQTYKRSHLLLIFQWLNADLYVKHLGYLKEE